ncbi:hypothetical protein [Mycolicibacterium bacteremicum]|uniref:Uncharacterized protein n=1 Tax=Mycolicibacterium bacteremicum TaxID=564198 RepID=A0A1W9YZQ7_MYCBA|nr:hypothetical protein [Mycolicibacterium bacteremicum]MCV7435308.1 hypothetical protein [Mycolicibacterium bacteremicum]ORA05514.1 hypothetical protein BST17_10015 [Mycolicibacterium bacteremicum]
MRLIALFAVPALVGAGLSLAPLPTAAADCTSAGGTTICSQGDVRGANTGSGPSGSGPYAPSPCDIDWMDCDDWYGGWTIDVYLDPDIGAPGPGRPDIGRPNPGPKPGGGRGGGRGGRR